MKFGTARQRWWSCTIKATAVSCIDVAAMFIFGKNEVLYKSNSNWRPWLRWLVQNKSAAVFCILLRGTQETTFTADPKSTFTNSSKLYAKWVKGTRTKARETNLHNAQMNKKPGISRHHNVPHALISFLVSDVISPSWERDRDRMGRKRRYSWTHGNSSCHIVVLEMIAKHYNYHLVWFWLHKVPFA